MCGLIQDGSFSNWKIGFDSDPLLHDLKLLVLELFHLYSCSLWRAHTIVVSKLNKPPSQISLTSNKLELNKPPWGTYLRIYSRLCSRVVLRNPSLPFILLSNSINMDTYGAKGSVCINGNIHIKRVEFRENVRTFSLQGQSKLSAIIRCPY